MSNEEYFVLQQCDVSWRCKKCQREAMPFFNISNSDSIFDTSDVEYTTAANADHNTPTQLQHQKQSDSLTFYYANRRSLLPKIDHLRLLASSKNPDIIAICESWVDDTISDDELFIPGYSIVHRNRDRHRGGIVLYIQESIPFTNTMTHPSIELLLVNLRLRNEYLVCGVFYRLPVLTSQFSRT